METEKFTAADQLSNLKNLFSRFVDALNDVNEQNGACPAEHHSAIDDYMVSDVGSTPNTNHSESNVKSTGDVNVRKDRAQYLSDIGDDDWNNSSVMSWTIDGANYTISRFDQTVFPVQSFNQEKHGSTAFHFNHDEMDYTILQIGDPDLVTLNEPSIQQSHGSSALTLNASDNSNRNGNIHNSSGEPQLHMNNQVMEIDLQKDHDVFCIDLEYLNEIQKAHHNAIPENVEQKNDDYDENILNSIVENNENLLDTEFSSEVHNNLNNILETLNERGIVEINSVQHNETTREREPAEIDLIVSNKGMASGSIVSESECSLRELCLVCSAIKTINDRIETLILDLSVQRLIGSCDTTKMFVRTSDQKRKKLPCPYCMKLVCKLSRHVKTKHKNEKDVIDLTSSNDLKTIRNIQKRIRINGMFKWNTNPSNFDKELIVSRRPNSKLNKIASDYLICPNCIGIHTITNLRNHFTKCAGGAFKGVRNVKVLSRAIEGRVDAEANEQLREVIPVMREDAIVRLIRYDPLLIVYGNLLCLKYHFHFQQSMIRAKLRLAGRLLEAMRIINAEVTDFASIYFPKRYKFLIEAIKVVGKFNPATNEFGTPATAASALTLIKQIGSILKCEYMQAEDPVLVKKTEDFLYLMDSEFSKVISKRVKENQQQKRREKNHKIPSKNDVRLLSAFLNQERKKCFEEISVNFSIDHWVKLLELTIASIIVFNRRRVGETQNILESDFVKRESIDETTHEELFNALSDEAKEVARRFCRMKIRGKKGSNVNVLLKLDIVRCLEVLRKHRVQAGVPPENPFLFGLPKSPFDNRLKVVNACNVLATISTKCGAEDPSTLRGTNLRKHFASFCMAMELSDDMTSEVAKHMGHAEEVHRQFYRHNTIDREIVKVSQLLEVAQGEPDDDDDDDDEDDDCDDNGDEYVIVTDSAQQSATEINTNNNKQYPKRKTSKGKIDSKKKSSVKSVVGSKPKSQTGKKPMKVNQNTLKKKRNTAATARKSKISKSDLNSAESSSKARRKRIKVTQKARSKSACTRKKNSVK